MSDVNIPLLRKALEWAEAEAAKPAIDRQWDQNYWVRPAEQRAVDLLPEEFDIGSMAEQVAAHCGTAFCIAGWVSHEVMGSSATGILTEWNAADELRIDNDQAGALFDPDNTIEDVRRIAEEIAGERL